MFTCEFYKISKNTFFIEHFRWLFLLIVAICTVLFWKLYTPFKKKHTLSQWMCNFFFKMLQMRFSRLPKNMKFTRATCWINSKISNRDKNTTLIILFCHYCWSLLRCNYLKYFKVGLLPSENITLFASMKALQKWWEMVFISN